MGDGTDGTRTRRAVIGGMLGLGATAFVGRGLEAITSGGGRIDDRARAGPAIARRVNPPTRRSWETGSIGASLEGRPIEILRSVSTIQRTHVLVVGAVHGNEPVARPIVDALYGATIPDDMSLSLIPTANPDGWAAGTRRNARGVDLNRNFPWRWRPSTGGPGPGSELETQALMHTLLAERPDLVIWIHQPLDYVAPVPGCPFEYADAWIGAAGTRRRIGLDQHGGSETWSARSGGLRSMLVEVATWNSTPEMIARHVAGFEACAQIVEPA